MEMDISSPDANIKSTIGGKFFDSSTILLPLVISPEQRDEWLEDMELLKELGNMVMEQLLIMLKHVCDLNKIGEHIAVSQFENNYKLGIINTGMRVTHIFEWHNEQLNSLISKLKETNIDDTLIIGGDEYCFILLFIKNIFMDYCMVMDMWRLEAHIDDEKLMIFHHNMVPLLMARMNVIRQKFKLIDNCKVLFSQLVLH